MDFDPGSFTSASLLEVIEHIEDQDRVLRALRRVIADSGHLIVTVPKRHVFSFLDTGNWRFVFPRLHRVFVTARHSASYYHARCRNPETGLVGDIEAAKGWHEHFSEEDLRRLLARNGFSVRSVDRAGLFARPLGVLGLAVPVRAFQRLIRALQRLDARTFRSVHLFVLAVPVPGPERETRASGDS